MYDHTPAISCVFQHFVHVFEWFQVVLLWCFAQMIGNYCIFMRFLTKKLAGQRTFSLQNPSFSTRKRLGIHLGQVIARFFQQSKSNKCCLPAPLPSSDICPNQCIQFFLILRTSGQLGRYVFFSTYPSRNQWCLYTLLTFCFHVLGLSEQIGFSCESMQSVSKNGSYTRGDNILPHPKQSLCVFFLSVFCWTQLKPFTLSIFCFDSTGGFPKLWASAKPRLNLLRSFHDQENQKETHETILKIGVDRPGRFYFVYFCMSTIETTCLLIAHARNPNRRYTSCVYLFGQLRRLESISTL